MTVKFLKRPSVVRELNPFRVDLRTRGAKSLHFRLTSGIDFELPPFSPLGLGDLVEFSSGDEYPSVVVDDGATTIALAPAWSATYFIEMGSQRIRMLVKEVETESEMKALAGLKQFHYRDQKTAGRAVPLIAVTSHPLLPEVIGFIEITSAMLVNNARKSIVNRPFTDSERGVAWQRWDMATAKVHTSRLARISRCVVYPELRGLGIASKLARAATDYTRERWHYGGVRPLFLEITADMLRYSPFVVGAGFLFVGDTEGNEDRMLRDMRYLLHRTIKSGSEDDFPTGGGGIMSLQRSCATTLLGVMQRRKLDLEQLLNLLRRSPETLDDDEWIALHRVFRRPKPTYMIGLTKAAEAHLKLLAPIRRREVMKRSAIDSRVDNSHLVFIENLRIGSVTKPSSSPRSRKVAEAFGIVSKSIETTILSGLSMSVERGQAVLVTGPSGTGKSLLLKVVAGGLSGRTSALPESVHCTFDKLIGSRRVEWVKPLASDEAAIDMLAALPIEESLARLSDAGLAEASLFVRPASTLSDGQSYRLAIACALATNPEVLFIDAFCESLDDMSAAAVCKSLRDKTRRTGLTVIAATAAPERLLRAFAPDSVIQLLPGRTHKVMPGSQYLSARA